jgi:hypothetical protein
MYIVEERGKSITHIGLLNTALLMWYIGIIVPRSYRHVCVAIPLHEPERASSFLGRKGGCDGQKEVKKPMEGITLFLVLNETLENTDPHSTLETPVYMLHEQGRSTCSDLVYVLPSGDV